MTTSATVANAQGAMANQTLLASKIASKMAPKVAFALIIVFTAFYSSGFSQQYDTLNVATQGFSIIAPSTVLDQGESATFYILLGSASQPVDGAVAFSIYLNLSANAVLPDDPAFDTGNSWLMDEDATLSEGVDPSAWQISLTAQRSDMQGQTGYGEVFRVSLVAAEDNVSAETMITNGGGLVIVEDIGFKRDPSYGMASESFEVYPNPCQGQLNFNWNGKVPDSGFLLDMNGNASQIPTSALTFGSANLQHLAPGIYTLVLNFGDGRETRRIRIN